MSLFGHFVIARSEQPLDQLPSIQRLCTESRDEDVRPATVVGRWVDGPWQQLQTFDGDDVDIRQLVAKTQAPAMSIYVVESEFGYIDARAPSGVDWWGYLNPDVATQAYDSPDPPAPLESIADQAVAWAAEAGKNATRTDVISALSERVGPFGEGVDLLMRALGFQFGDNLITE
jgi:hypothetical protein